MAQFKTAQQTIAPPPREQRLFESRFRARVEDSKEYRQWNKPELEYRFQEKDYFHPQLEVVPMKAIHLPIEQFQMLLNQQEYIEKLETEAEHGQKLYRKEQSEFNVRQTNPAVEKAYRNYMMLLELARK